MSDKIRIAVVGYGNLGRGTIAAVEQNADMELVGVFTRRDPATLNDLSQGIKAYHVDMLDERADSIDVLVLCGGSATDLPKTTPELAAKFIVVDSFDNHSKIPEHFANVDSRATAADKLAIISVGWDPGMFSLNRAISSAILPVGNAYTFWGPGVSQGHSDAVRRIEGVLDARQYTIPVRESLEAVRSGLNPELSTRQKHTRLVYVVAKADADQTAIESKIKNMPAYFADYDTTVEFISSKTMAQEHAGLPHGGSVFRSGKTGYASENTQVIEYRLNLDSNPQFTSSILATYARAAYRMYKDGFRGAKTVFDVAPRYLLNLSDDEMRATLL